MKLTQKLAQKIQRYDLTLHRLSATDLELVRQWRNDPKISRHMFFQETITPEMQQKWFEGLDPERDHYFVVEADSRKIGLVNLKGLDRAAPGGPTAESGIFIHDDAFTSGIVPVKAYLALLDYAFEDLGLARVVGHARRDNTRAIRFNEGFGFKIVEKESDAEGVWIELTREAYDVKAAKLKRMFGRG